MVNGDGDDANLVRQRFDHIFFTGGGRIGAKVWKVLQPTSRRHPGARGKNPAIVLDDADLEVTARRLVWGKGFNAGQACVAPDHLLVQESVRIPAGCHRTKGSGCGPQPLDSRIWLSGSRQALRQLETLLRVPSGGACAAGSEVDLNAAESHPA